MNKTKLISTICVLCLNTIILTGGACSQTLHWLWVGTAIGGIGEYAESIDTDHNGHTYVAGIYGPSSATFGPFTLNSAGQSDAFLLKYDASGNEIWVKRAGGTNYDQPMSVKVDPAGDIIVSGFFTSPVFTIDTINLTSAGLYDVFHAKYNSNGDLIWAKSAGGTNDEWLLSSDVDAAGNTIVAGWFKSSTITFGSYTLTNTGAKDMFIVKYDQNGNVLWARNASCTGDDEAKSVIVDSSGNILVTGYYTNSSMTLGGVTLTTSGDADMYFAKYDAGGNVLWAKKAGGGSADYGSCIAASDSGYIYVAGEFYSGVFYIGSTTLSNSSGTSDIFLAKYNNIGNLLWVKKAGGNDWDRAQSIDVYPNGNILMSGLFESSILTIDTISLSVAGCSDGFLAKFSGSGRVIWAVKGGGTSCEWPLEVMIDENNDVYWCGAYTSPSISFGPITLTNNGNYDMYVAKLSHCELQDPLITPGGSTTFCPGGSVILTSSPSPAGTYLWSNSSTLQSITATSSGTYAVTIYDNTGCTASASMQVSLYPAPATPVITHTGNMTFCEGDSVKLSTAYAFAYLWSDSSMTQSITVDTTGIYSVTVFNSYGCSAISAPVVVTENPYPVPVITQAGHLLTSNYVSGNQWHCNGILISGAIQQNYTVPSIITDTSCYSVRVTILGCAAFSDTACFNPSSSGIEALLGDVAFSIIPNPSNGKFMITNNDEIDAIEIYNVLGESIYFALTNSKRIDIDLSGKPEGIYFVKVQCGEKIYCENILLQ